MKTITIGFALLCTISASVRAQDYKKLRAAIVVAQMSKNDPAKLEAAKSELDKVLADPKAENNVETYLLKSEVLGTIAGSPTLKAKYPTADAEAFQALKKYLDMDPKGEKIKADNYIGLNEISRSFSTDASAYMNAKNWDSAFYKFQNVVDLSDLFIKNKWSNVAFDTVSYYYAGASAQNAKKADEAAKYYSALGDRKITGKDYEFVYDYLTKYYLNANNQPQFQKYLAIAKESYPANTEWNDLEFANMMDNSSPEDVEKTFDEADAAKKLASKNYFDYGDYFINNKKVKEADAAKKTVYSNKSFYAFSKAAELDTANGIASYNAGVAAYTLFDDANEAARKIKGVTPDIKAKRAQADKVADAAAGKSILWIEKSFTSLSAKTNRTNVEKNVLSKATDLLYNLYAYKKDRSKVLNPKDYDRFDAKEKFYDSMHGKF